jgi:hypothetical protein
MSPDPVVRPQHSTLRIQLVELALAAVPIFLAVEYGTAAAAYLVAAGVLIAATALSTNGPIGIVRRFTIVSNLAMLAVVGAVMVLTPIAFRAARSGVGIATLEGVAVLIGALVVSSIRRIPRGRIRARRSPMPEEPNARLSSTARIAGRLVGQTQRTTSAQVPLVARRLGKFVGTRRSNRDPRSK